MCAVSLSARTIVLVVATASSRRWTDLGGEATQEAAVKSNFLDTTQGHAFCFPAQTFSSSVLRGHPVPCGFNLDTVH